MIALSLFSMKRFTTYTAYSDQVDHTNLVIKKILQTQIYLRDIDRTERGYMLTRDTMYIRFLNNAIDSVQTVIDEIGIITKDNPVQQNNISLVKSSAAIRIAAVRENITYVDTTTTTALSKFYYDSREMMKDFSLRIRKMLAEENKILAVRYENEMFYQKLTISTLTWLLIIFCIVTLILFFIMIKELRGRMRYQQELQSKVIDLKRSHDELKEIAYAASHDLQEPLRKIQVFSNMLLFKNKNSTDKDSMITLSRINNSANRMQLLISDLMSLTSLIKLDENRKLVDLNRTLQFILIDIDDKVKEKNAIVEVQSLAIVSGFENQLKLLFRALLDNALKFSREGVIPEIVLCCDIMTGDELYSINPNLSSKKFYRITCKDNGIGFDNKFIDKMFHIFQRLHTDGAEYDGKGIGLAICQRIMANHEGYIIANGVPQKSAEFKLFFPIEI
ncbi:MAG: hypothetical protein JWQ38_3085 [Flavipsychrobacter sp.]|nr:hypothetical protein [Flavipsychrobacter sp.]